MDASRDEPADESIDESALVAAFHATLPELYAFVARRVGGERTLAEDVTQETWLRAVAAWRRTGPPRVPLAWLKTTARNLILNHFRDARRCPLVSVPIDLDAQAAGDGGALATSASAARLHHALARLGERDAALIEAFHLDGRSTRELALEHGLTERAVEGRLRRARRKLERLLERRSP